MVWQFGLIYLICGLINTVIVILQEPEIVYHREKIIIFSAFLFFPLFICFYLFVGIYAMLKLIAPAVWWLLDKIADRGQKEDFGEDINEEDNIGNDLFLLNREDEEEAGCDVVSCQTHCPCFRDVGK